MQGFILFFIIIGVILILNGLIPSAHLASIQNKRDEDLCVFPNDFRTAVIILGAAMMKRQTTSKKDEFLYFRKYYEQHFHIELSTDVIALLRTSVYMEIPVSRICYQLSQNISYEERIHLLHFLYGFAASDQFISRGEMILIRLIGRFLKIHEIDMDSISAFYFSEKKSFDQPIYASIDHYYSILGVQPTSGHTEIQKAYRKQAMKHHPDRVSHLGPEFQVAAKEKFQIIVDAYKRIKKARGF